MTLASPAPASDALLLRETIDSIAVLTLNRPEARNSLSEALLRALEAEVDRDRRRSFRARRRAHSQRSGVLGRARSQGADARRSDPDGGRAYFAHIMTLCSAVMQQIVRLPQPVIAAVHGTATAAGCQLVASCDLAVASTAARFATPGVNIGLFCSTPMVALSRNVAPKHAMELLLTGDAIAAEDAARIGLVNRVVAPGTERDEALALAHKIAAKSRHVVKIGKEAFYRQIDMDLAAGL